MCIRPNHTLVLHTMFAPSHRVGRVWSPVRPPCSPPSSARTATDSPKIRTRRVRQVPFCSTSCRGGERPSAGLLSSASEKVIHSWLMRNRTGRPRTELRRQGVSRGESGTVCSDRTFRSERAADETMGTSEVIINLEGVRNHDALLVLPWYNYLRFYSDKSKVY